MTRYPHAPGYAADSATSRAAAQAVLPEMKPLHRAIIGVIRRSGPMTADEIAIALERHILTIRPRLTELRELGLVERTTDTRPSALGNGQHVMRLTDAGHDAAENTVNPFHSSTVETAPCDSTGQTQLNFPQ